MNKTNLKPGQQRQPNI